MSAGDLSAGGFVLVVLSVGFLSAEVFVRIIHTRPLQHTGLLQGDGWRGFGSSDYKQVLAGTDIAAFREYLFRYLIYRIVLCLDLLSYLKSVHAELTFTSVYNYSLDNNITIY